MPKPSFNYVIACIEEWVKENGLILRTKNKGGSVVRIEIFKNDQTKEPIDFWVFHRDSILHKGDLNKLKQRGFPVDRYFK